MDTQSSLHEVLEILMTRGKLIAQLEGKKIIMSFNPLKGTCRLTTEALSYPGFVPHAVRAFVSKHRKFRCWQGIHSRLILDEIDSTIVFEAETEVEDMDHINFPHFIREFVLQSGSMKSRIEGEGDKDLIYVHVG